MNNYSGGTIIKGGVLQLDGNNTASSGVIAVNAGTLSGTGIAAGAVTVAADAHLAPGDNFGGTHFTGTLTVGGLTLQSGANLDMNLGNNTDLLLVNGDLDLQGGILNVQDSGGFQATNYELIQFTGNLVDANLSLGNLPSGQGFNYTIVNNPDGYPGSIWLDVTSSVVTPTGPFTWTGANGEAWDIIATTNWSSPSGPSTYVDGYNVTFDDSALGTATSGGLVTIDTTVRPASITVNNSTALAYTFSGNGSIAGATSLTKENNGLLTIAMSGNTYYGGTTITGGTVQIGASSVTNGTTLTSGPLGTGPVTLVSGGVLDLAGNSLAIASLSDSGVAGGLVTSSAGAGELVLMPTAGSTTFSGAINDAGGTVALTLNGNGAQVLTGVSNYSGATTVNSGGLGAWRGANIQNTTGLTVGSNGTLAIDAGALLNVNGNVSIATPVVVAGTMTNSSPTATIATSDFLVVGGVASSGSVTLAAGQTMSVFSPGNGSWSTANGYGLQVAAGGTFNMTGGSLTVDAGGPSEMIVGTAGIGGSGSGPAVLNISGGSLLCGQDAIGGGGVMGLFIGTVGANGLVTQSGGIVVVHGMGGQFALGADGWDATSGGGYGEYDLSGGTLVTSVGAAGWADWAKSTLIGWGQGTGVVTVSGQRPVAGFPRQHLPADLHRLRLGHG